MFHKDSREQPTESLIFPQSFPEIKNRFPGKSEWPCEMEREIENYI